MLLNGKFDWSIKFLIIVVTFVRLFGQFGAESGVCSDGDVRLAEGSSYREGIVEVCRNKEWGRVCDDDWDERESTVVCRQLGFSEEGAIVNNMMSNIGLPFVLDDVGCNGTETNLLECLPQHNCQPTETAGVRCLLKGVTLEHEGGNLGNNSLISLDDIGKGILCVTDKTLCCSEADGNWYLPGGTLLPSDTVSSNSQNLYITREGNQTVRLNMNMTGVNVSQSSSSFGIYTCAILDRLNNLQHLFVGVYPPNEGNIINVTIHYNKERQLITCLSKGGPVTIVTWSLNNRTISIDGQTYENSQAIINTTSSVYESKLRIVDKTSAMAGVYMCVVSNPMGSLHAELDIQVCRDMEFRINSDSNAHTTAEVCIDDQWYPIDSAVNLNDHPPRNVKVNIDANSALLRVEWQPPSGSATVDHYDTFCSTVKIDSSRYQMVKVGNLSPDINVADISFPLQSAMYNCCVTAHVRRPSLQLQTTSIACVSLSVPGSLVGNLCINSQYTIGFGSALGFMVLLLPIVCLVCLCIALSYKCQVRPTRNVRALDPEDMHPNPIYDRSNDASEQCGRKYDTNSPEQSASATPRYASTDDLIVTSSANSVAENPQYGTSTGVAYYEIIDDFPTKKQKGTVHLQEGKAGNTQIYYNVVAKRDDTAVYCNADVNN